MLLGMRSGVVGDAPTPTFLLLRDGASFLLLRDDASKLQLGY